MKMAEPPPITAEPFEKLDSVGPVIRKKVSAHPGAYRWFASHTQPDKQMRGWMDEIKVN